MRPLYQVRRKPAALLLSRTSSGPSFLRQTKPVALENVQRWIKANLGMDVSIATVSRHKDEMGLSFQLTGSQETKPGLTRDEYILGFFECVLDLRRTGFFEFDHRRIICIDFVTNSMRIEKRKTRRRSD
jgi:hypothetical protein